MYVSFCFTFTAPRIISYIRLQTSCIHRFPYFSKIQEFPLLTIAFENNIGRITNSDNFIVSPVYKNILYTHLYSCYCIKIEKISPTPP